MRSSGLTINGTSAQMPDGRGKGGQIRQWFNTSVFSIAQAFTFGTAGRTLRDVRYPGRANYDLSMFKEFRIKERINVTFRAEVFNALNKAQFGRANAQVGNTELGTINSTAVPPRQVQLALKLRF